MDATTLSPQPSALVVGAGPVGALTALGLWQQGWQVRLLEKEALTAHNLPSSYDNRQLALTPQSVDWLTQTLKLTDLSAKLTPITHIHTSSKGHFGSMLMTASQQGVPALGYTIAQRALGEVIFAQLKQTQIQFITGVQLDSLRQSNEQVILTGNVTDEPVLQKWQADRLFAADGAHSWIRNQLAISSETRHYPHQLMTCIGTLSETHQQGAVERFTPSGPTAMLPLADAYQVKLVYCYDLADIDQVTHMDHDALVERINAQLGKAMPQVTAISEVMHYPLVEVKPERIQSGRVLLMGNAAHTQHPVAGQGLNLGIRDVQAVVAWSQDADEQAWHEMANARLKDHRRIMRATHGLVTLFSHPQALVQGVASAGLTLLNVMTPLKKRITRMAMGY
ncbi:MAG: FAD-dependent monooxygenase [Gammaproteobacteria bacterium]|nr:FAD-dependent monooxygenase [Gammaproteobacteria bacterium]